MTPEEKRITYLFGAGASAGKCSNYLLEDLAPRYKVLYHSPTTAIPVLNEFKLVFQDLESWINVLLSIESSRMFSFYDGEILFTHYQKSKIERSWLEIIRDDINRYGKISNGFKTVDTYAKTLYIKRKFESLETFKSLIGLSLSFRQLLYGRDIRYDSFFTSILESFDSAGTKIAPKVNFISWNYDFMIEQTFKEYNFTDYLPYPDVHSHERDLKKNRTYLIKLNGSSNGFSSKNPEHYGHMNAFQNYSYELTAESFLDAFANLCRNHISFRDVNQNNSSGILFAWEKNELSKSSREMAQSILTDTEILVIIGYSFPVFNRSVDYELLKDCNPKEIYVQVPDEKSFKDIYTRLKSIKPEWDTEHADEEFDEIDGPYFNKYINCPITHIQSVDEFYIPSELILK